MNMQSEKLKLARLILDTEDQEVINQLKAFFQTRPSSSVWFEELPESVQTSVERGLSESERNEGTPHKDVKSKYQKWLSK